jgi:hypothetical protein
MLIDKDPKSRALKEDLFNKLDEYLGKLGSDPKINVTRKCA